MNEDGYLNLSDLNWSFIGGFLLGAFLGVWLGIGITLFHLAK